MDSEKPLESLVEDPETREATPEQSSQYSSKKRFLIGLTCTVFLLVTFLISFVFYKNSTKPASVQKEPTITHAPEISPIDTDQTKQNVIQKITATATLTPTIHKIIATATPTVRIITSTPTPAGQSPLGGAPVAPSPIAVTTYSISGNVYIDDNQNKSKDGNEQGLAGVTVYFISIGKSTTTDSSGHYSMEGLAPGQYNISPNAPSGYRGEDTNPGFVTITNTDANIDFPFVPN